MAFYDQWPKGKKIVVGGAAFLAFGSLASMCGETQQEKAAKAAKRAAAEVAARPPAPVLAQAPTPVAAPEPPPPPLEPKKALEAKIAALVAEEDRDAKYEFKAGALSVTTEDPTEHEKLAEFAMSAHWTLKGLARTGFAEIPELGSVTVVQFGHVLDERGNDRRLKMAELTMTRATSGKINWQKVPNANIPHLADKSWWRPGISIMTE